MNDMKFSSEDLRIYAPEDGANNCCYICKKSIDGCSWSRSLEPVKGWKAIECERKYSSPSYKILYCPEFEEGNAAKGREWDEDGCMNLVEALYKATADDFKNAYKKKLKLERYNAELFENEIEIAEGVMHNCSFLLGEWTEPLKAMVKNELGLEEGAVNAKKES